MNDPCQLKLVDHQALTLADLSVEVPECVAGNSHCTYICLICFRRFV